MAGQGAPADEARVEGRGALSAVVALAAVVSAMVLIAPIVVGALITRYGFTVRQAAFTLSSELAAMSLATLPALWWLPRCDWRAVLRVSLVVMIAGNLLCLAVGSFPALAALRFATGLAGGSIMLVCLAAVGLTSRRERNFGWWAAGQLVLGAVGLAALPRVLPVFGLGALYAALAVLLALLWPTVAWMPRRAPAPEAEGGGRIVRGPTLAGLAGILVFYVALSGVWAYLERIGAQGGLSAARIGDDLMIASLFGIAGCFSAVWLGARWGRRVPLLIGYALLVGSVALFYAPVRQPVYLFSASVFKYAWTFALPYLLACIAARDDSGRLLSLANLMIGTGLALGPSVVALTLAPSPDYRQSLRVGIIGGVVSLLLVAFLELGGRRGAPGRSGASAASGGVRGALVATAVLCGLTLFGSRAVAQQPGTNGPQPSAVAQQSHAMPQQPPAGGFRLGTGLAGQAVFVQHCAMCHADTGVAAKGEGRAPTLYSLQQLPPERVLDSLVSGKMMAIGAQLSGGERRAVAEWLGGRPLGAAEAGEAAKMTNRCAAPARARAAAEGDWNGWGAGVRNVRFQARPGFTGAQVASLKLRWAFGFPGGAETYSQPTVVGGSVYIGDDNGYVYSIEAHSGCVHWSFRARAGVRTAPTVAPVGHARRLAVFFGDLQGYVYAVDAVTGKAIWTTRADDQPLVKITGAPTYADGRLYVDTTTGEEVTAAAPNYPCCRTRGTVSAIDAASGRILWKTYLIRRKPRPVGKNAAGTTQWAPAGVGAWSAPTVDDARHLLYVTTGDSYTAPAAPLSDSIVALDLSSGRVAWHYQDIHGDAWLAGCMPGRAFGNCPKSLGPDWDYGSSAMLLHAGEGARLVGANKGGLVMAIDPAHRGALLWRRSVARGMPGAGGEIVFGGASDGRDVYYGLDSGAVIALDATDGAVRWRTPIEPARPNRAGISAAVSAMPGVLFAGGWDGVLRAFATGDGHQIWSFDTARAFETVNGVEAKGGSMGAPGPTIAEGMVFVGSGYVGVGSGMPGNVLLAFAPD